jgi:peptidoglycan hydrolase-like protein with peptidoglycan-binding domain
VSETRGIKAMTIKQSPPGFVNIGGPLIQKIQSQLNALGLDAGAVDGVWGQRTANAIKGWQDSMSENWMAQFGAETAEAVAKFQKAKVGAMYVDTVIRLQTGKALPQDNED